MVKRGLVLFVIVFSLIVLPSFTSAASCRLDASLVNQDPYPAVQDEYVKLLFQIEGEGVSEPSCGKIYFELIENYPISFDPGTAHTLEISSGTFARNYNNFIMVPIKVRIDKEALDGDNQITIRYGHNFFSGSPSVFTSDFNLSVQDVKVEFEIFVKDYDPETNTLIFDLLNTGKSDAESVVVEIPLQENIAIKGGNSKILGALDSNEDNSVTFEAVPNTGEIKLIISYTDEALIRRTTEQSVQFNGNYFQGRKEDEKSTPTSFYVAIALGVILVLFLLRGKFMRKKKHFD